MNKKISKIKRVLALCLIFLLSINTFAAIVSDNDGSAFVTKAEFDALKTSFADQINNYNNSIDWKIDGAIASYLAGLSISEFETKDVIYNDANRVIAVNNENQLRYEPKRISISVYDWADYNNSIGSKGLSTNSGWDIYYFLYDFISPDYEKRWLMQDFRNLGRTKYQLIGHNDMVSTTLAITTNKLKSSTANAVADEAKFYNHYPSLLMNDNTEVSKKLDTNTFINYDLMENFQLYYYRSDDKKVVQDYVTITPEWTTNVINIKYDDETERNMTTNDYLVCNCDLSFICGNVDHPEWVLQNTNSKKLSDLIGDLNYRLKGHMDTNTWINRLKATTALSNPTVRNNQPGSKGAADTKYAPSFGVCRASASEIKLGSVQTLNLKTGSFQLSDNTLVDGFPLLCEKKSNIINYDMNMVDKSANYKVWVKFGPFSGEPIAEECLDVRCNGVVDKVSTLINGVGRLQWTMPESGIVYIKWEKQNNVTDDIGILNLEVSNTYNCQNIND